MESPIKSLLAKPPEKPVNPLRRMAMSVKQIRQEAEKLRESGRVVPDRPDPLISFSPSKTHIAKSRKTNGYTQLPRQDEIPEEKLPEPFNQSNRGPFTNEIKDPNLSMVPTDAFPEQQPTAASHLSRSFQRHFSKHISSHNALKISKEPSRVHLQTSALSVSEPPFDHSVSKKGVCKSTAKKHIVFGDSIASAPLQLPTSLNNLDSEKNGDFSSMETASIQKTPAKHISTPEKLMSATPELQPPKRCFMSPDDDSVKSPNKLTRRPSRRRSLKFNTPVKNETSSSGRLSVDDDIFEILPDNLLESIREKEKKALEEKNVAITQAKFRRQMISNLPKLFDMLLFLFQSIKLSVITKQELVHRIISSHLEIVDRREVIEQLRLLQELVPEWIYEKLTSSGDLLLCINKISSPESIRTRLAEAQ